MSSRTTSILVGLGIAAVFAGVLVVPKMLAEHTAKQIAAEQGKAAAQRAAREAAEKQLKEDVRQRIAKMLESRPATGPATQPGSMPPAGTKQELKRAGFRLELTPGASAEAGGPANEAWIKLPGGGYVKLMLLGDEALARRVRELTVESMRTKFAAIPSPGGGAFDTVPTVARSAIAGTVDGTRFTFDTAVIAGPQKAMLVVAATPQDNAGESIAAIRQMLSTLQLQD